MCCLVTKARRGICGKGNVRIAQREDFDGLRQRNTAEVACGMCFA